MGVKGLTTYINAREDVFLKPFLLHDSRVVIDGHSLCAQLYRRLNSFSAFGGDYDKYASYVKTFFKNLRKCNITSYVLFDGSYEQRKLRTALSRVLSKIKGASQLDPVTQGSLQIFPLLFRDVFIQVLEEMLVPYTVCEFEADDELASMARHLNCPVLSYDSDFFIYNVLYIPFNALEFKPVSVEENDSKFYALNCKIYRAVNLTEHFGIKEELLPLLATLLGNDFVEKRIFNKFFSQMKLPKSRKSMNEKQKCINGLFKWLENETLDSAISKVLGRFKKDYKHKALAAIKRGIDGYNNKVCHSLQYFSISTETSTANVIEVSQDIVWEDKPELHEDGDSDIEENNEYDNETISDKEEGSEDNENPTEVSNLPEFIAKKIRLNQIPKAYINLYTHHLYFCNPQAEDYTDKDSMLGCLPLMRYSFDIMTDFSEEQCVYYSRVRDRQYERIYLDKEYAIPRLIDTPFEELSIEYLNKHFYHFLDHKMKSLDLSCLQLLPANFKLYMLSMLWWVSTSQVPLGHIHSLLMCYVMLEVIDEKTGTFRGHYHFNNKYSKKLEEIKKNPTTIEASGDLYLNKNKVQYDDCLLAASTLLKHFELDDKIKKKPKTYDTKRMHSFAQFQCSLMHFNCLNVLCANPLESTKYSKSFNGTFVYNIAVKLENQEDPCKFFDQYLKGATTVLMFYKSLCTVYEKCAASMKLETAVHRTVKKRRKKHEELMKNKEIDFIVQGFEAEVVI